MLSKCHARSLARPAHARNILSACLVETSCLTYVLDVPLDSPVPTFVYQSTLAEQHKPKPVGGGMFRAKVPGELTVRPAPDDPEPLEHEVVMQLDVIDDRLVCTSCEIKMIAGGPGVTADALRRIPVGRYLRAADVAVVEVDPADKRKVRTFVRPPRDFAARGMSDEVLRDVARLYHWALATGDAPLGLLEREYGVPRGRASRWIATARRRGYVKDEPDGR